MLQVVKLDAAQFFKAASVDRGVRRTAAMLERVHEKTNKDAVSIHRVPHVKGNLCSDRKHASSLIRVITFEEIVSTLRLARHDNRFLLGECVIERLGGWPMGDYDQSHGAPQCEGGHKHGANIS